MTMFPTPEEMHGDQFRAYMTDNAPACPSCGTLALEAVRMPEVDKLGQIDPNGDRVVAALEVYRCGSCGSKAVRKIELDRVTRDEQDRETDNAVSRAELRQELRRRYGVLGIFKRIDHAIDAEVQREFPRRPDPDLMKRWQERRGL